ncbi:MAG: hypothetical protein JWR48_3915 [Mycobacterium sp.]|nr:hypothetical protein [Mycobacterium sp.]
MSRKDASSSTIRQRIAGHQHHFRFAQQINGLHSCCPQHHLERGLLLRASYSKSGQRSRWPNEAFC